MSRLVAAALVLLLLLLSAPAARAAAPAHGRTWELVTTSPTNGVNPFNAQAWDDDGTHVVYLSFGPLPGAPSGDLAAANLATRGPSGWVSQPIGAPFSQPSVELRASEPLAVDTSFTAWAWRADQPLLPDVPPAPQNAYYRRAPDGALTLLGPVGNVGESQFVAASADTQHVVFQSTAHLLPADAGRVAGSDAYEFASSELRLLGLDSAGAALSACGSVVGNGSRQDDNFTHPVSRDGTRIWVSAPATSDCGTPMRVYLRVDGTQTLEASASACTRPDCSAPADVRFAGATRDGSAAFLLTAQQLTDDDIDAGVDLYRYDVASHALTRLSAGPPGVSADVAGSVVAISADGARVYFLAFGALVPGEGEAGRPNLYLSDHGTLRFVATVDDLNLHLAAVSSDGQVLAFRTEVPLLPSDLDPELDVYRYDARLGSLQQVTLGDGGRGNGSFFDLFATAGVFHPLQQDDVRYMSADGRHVLFVTAEPLVAEDVNDTSDVYEWADGTVGLVSSGAGDASVAYVGLSADGSTAFFTTDETLVSADRNGGDTDLYAARLGGGFPDAPPAPPPCADDACQGPPGARLARPTLDTLFHAGAPARARIHRLGRRARARLAATGRAIVVADVFAAGRVSLVVRARVDGRQLVVARDTADAHGAGPVRLRVQLSAAAGRLLRSGRPLRLTLIVRQADQEAASSLVARLRRKP